MAQKLQRDAEHNLQSFGQGGFDVVKVKGGAGGVNTIDSTNYPYGWVSISACDKAVLVRATTASGDALTPDGQISNAGYVKLAPGQTIFGDFTSITVPGIDESSQSTNTRIIAYRRVV